MFHLRHLLYLFGFVCLNFTAANSQNDSVEIVNDVLARQLEPFFDNLSDESSFEFNTIVDRLREFLDHPLNINTASIDDLQALGILSDVQIGDVLTYRNTLGDFISIYELQSIPSFDKPMLDVLRHFISVTGNVNDVQLSPWQMAKQGENELYLRWSRVPQTKRGYQTLQDTEAPYVGDPNQIYLRFRHNYQYKFSYGVTVEKDPGELFWNNNGKRGPDFLSYHLYVKDYNRRIKFLALGDYAIRLGQGLIMHSGFGRGKSSYATHIKRGGQTLRPYTSVNEAAFLRGAAVGLTFGSLDVTFFASHKREDANLGIDSLQELRASTPFSSLPQSGLHRTEAEQLDRAGVRRTVYGTRVGFSRTGLKVSFNAVRATFDREFSPNLKPYNQFYLPGSSLENLSLDYTFVWRNFHFFGEGAVSGNGGLGLVQGLLIGMSRYVDLALLYRNIDRSYQGIQPNVFLESSRAVNEKGIYLGSKISLHRSLWLNVYADFWTHPWLNFAADAPGNGREYLARITYYEKRKLEAYVQYRNEIKAHNFQDRLQHASRKQIRLQLNHRINRSFELRNRIEFSRTASSPTSSNRGFLILQDIIYKPISNPLSFTARIAYFDIEDYAARIYAYENDVLYSFSIPAYFGEGIRYYVNVRHKLSSAITFEMRWEETRFRDQKTIGTGNERIDGATRSRMKVQLRVRF